MTGTLTANGIGNVLNIPPRHSATWALTVASEESFVGTVEVLKTNAPGDGWVQVASYTGTVGVPLTGSAASGTVYNNGSEPIQLAVRVYGYGSVNGITYALAVVLGNVIRELYLQDGSLFERVTETSPRVQDTVLLLGDNTGLSRSADGVVCVGNGVAANASGTLKGAHATVTALDTYADNTAAKAGGLTAGQFYRTSTGVVMVVY